MFKYLLLLCLPFGRGAILADPSNEDYTADPAEDYTSEIVEHFNSISQNLKPLNQESLQFQILNMTLNELNDIVVSILDNIDDDDAIGCVRYYYEVIGDNIQDIVNCMNDLLKTIYARQKLLTACENVISAIQATCEFGVMTSTQPVMAAAFFRVEQSVYSIDEADIEEFAICLKTFLD